MKNTENLLLALGLSLKEISVYLTTLKYGSITPLRVSQLTKLNRTTVYAVAKQLVEKGILSQDNTTSASRLVALHPSHLEQLVTRKEKELEKTKQTLELAIPALAAIRNTNQYSVPTTTFISDEEINTFLYARTPIWHRNMISNALNTCWGFQDPSILAHYNDWIHWWHTLTTTQYLTTNLLTNLTGEEESVRKAGYITRNTKIWKGNIAFSSTVWVFGEYIIMLNSKKRPHYAIEIHDATLAENMRAMFSEIWKDVA